MTAADPLAPLVAMEPAALRCPYPHLERARAAAPAFWSEALQQFVVTDYHHVLDVLRRPECFSSSAAAGPVDRIAAAAADALADDPELAGLLATTMARQPSTAVLLFADPPHHERQRRLVNRAFSPRRVALMEPRIRAIATSLVDEFVDDGRVELVGQFAVGLPLRVIAEALGVEDEDLPRFKRWSDGFIVALGNTKVTKEQFADLIRSQVEFDEYFRAKIDERRDAPREDIISDVVHATIDGAHLAVDEMLGIFVQFLVAGNETTTKLIASAMLLLLLHPDVLARVQADHALIPGLVEEALRSESPVQGLYRVATQDAAIGGVDIPAGSILWLHYGAANRDASQFEEPGEFDIGRPHAMTHLAFGQGPHYCIGAALARTETRVAFETLLSRLDDIRIDGDSDRLSYEPSFVLHGLEALPLRFTRAR